MKVDIVSSTSNLLIVFVSFMHCTDLQAVRMPLLILLGVCTLSFLSLIFCWKFAIWWNSLLSLAWPHASIVCPMMLEWSIRYFFSESLFATIWSVLVSFFFRRKGTISLALPSWTNKVMNYNKPYYCFMYTWHLHVLIQVFSLLLSVLSIMDCSILQPQWLCARGFGHVLCLLSWASLYDSIYYRHPRFVRRFR